MALGERRPAGDGAGDGDGPRPTLLDGSQRLGAPPARAPPRRAPSTSPSRQTRANASPPTPVDIGSVTHSTAAAAMAASAALPPCSRMRSAGSGGERLAGRDHRHRRDERGSPERKPERHRGARLAQTPQMTVRVSAALRSSRPACEVGAPSAARRCDPRQRLTTRCAVYDRRGEGEPRAMLEVSALASSC